MSIKEELHSSCNMFVNKRLEVIKNNMINISDSLQSETKSSAGDKHETGRAMLQLEREKLGQQLVEIQKDKDILDKMGIYNTSHVIGLGSIVFTNNMNYYLAISAGKLTIGERSFFAISLDTPIAQLLAGKSVGDKIVFRDQVFTVTKVL